MLLGRTCCNEGGPQSADLLALHAPTKALHARHTPHPKLLQITHVLFDMDGLLLNTEEFYTIVQQNIAEEYGKTFNWEIKVLGGWIGEGGGMLTEQDCWALRVLPVAMCWKWGGELTQVPAPADSTTWHLPRNPPATRAQSKLLGLKAIEAARVCIAELGIQDRLTPEEFLAKREAGLAELFPTAELLPGAGACLRRGSRALHVRRVRCAWGLGLQMSKERDANSPGRAPTRNPHTMAGAAERLVRHLHAHGVPACLATSSNAHGYAAKTSSHGELFSLFEHRITGDEVTRGKPDPEIFLDAAARFSPSAVPGPHCLVFEDAPAGVTAARAAGMYVGRQAGKGEADPHALGASGWGVESTCWFWRRSAHSEPGASPTRAALLYSLNLPTHRSCVMVPHPSLPKSLITEEASLVLDSLTQFVPEEWGLPPYAS